MQVIERDRELERIESLLAQAGDGEGATLLIEGAAGLGKTSLLDLACEAAEGSGMRVLRARGGELEREFGFGVVRQLLTPLLRAADDGERRELLAGAARLAAGPLGMDLDTKAGPPSPGSDLHGLYWLCANLCDRGPLALAIDDLHWTDEPSIRVLAHLARRAAEHPLAILAVSRPVAADDRAARALSGLWSEALRLDPLSEDAVGRLIREELQADAEREFCAAAARATGGNPFLLATVIAALRVDGIPARSAEVGRLPELASETATRTILTRIGRVGPDAIAVARALSILGGDAELRRIARLAELTPEAATEALEGLRRAGIATPAPGLELSHPLVREAVEADLAEPASGLAQRRAARLLLEEGEPPERVAAHLAAAVPSDELWAVETLRAAAASALERGAPEPAVDLLERALAEPPPPSERGPLLAELGEALARAGREEEAIRALIEGAELTEEPTARARVALALGPLVYTETFGPEALAALREAHELLGDGDPELAARLEVSIAHARHMEGEPATVWGVPLEAAAQGALSPASRATCLSTIAYAAAATGSKPAVEVIRLASEASEHARLESIVRTAEGASPLPPITIALAISGRPSAALPLLDDAIDAASTGGDPATFAFFSTIRARTHLAAGATGLAEVDAWAGLSAAETAPGGVPVALGSLLLALVERGRIEEAQREVAARSTLAADKFDRLQDFALLHGRASLRLAEGRAADALADSLRLGEWLVAVGLSNPAYSHWRSSAARAHIALGEAEPARRLAAEELDLARQFGAPREIGIALRLLGLLEGDERGLSRLSESVSTLEESEAKLELARSLAEQGAALRRAGQRRESRKPLRRGLDLAWRCGAAPLAERAREELRAAGGRPRREPLSGPDSLTPSERRVARLAADGRSNREIAQALFVTRRTVEGHLTAAYRKLMIDSREELAAALGDDRLAD